MSSIKVQCGLIQDSFGGKDRTVGGGGGVVSFAWGKNVRPHRNFYYGRHFFLFLFYFFILTFPLVG